MVRPDARSDQIDKPLIQSYVDFCHEQFIKIWTGGSRKPTVTEDDDRFWRTTEERRDDASTNRYIATLKTALTLAYEARELYTKQRLLAEVPEFPDLAESNNAPRPVPLGILAAIVNEGPEHLSKAIVLTRLVGFRKMEALTLRVDQVDFDNHGV